MAEDRNEGNIVMFPFMAQGHLIPFLALARQIEQRHGGYTITIVNTPLNICKLKCWLPPETTIRLVEIPFSAADHGLPPDSENTDMLSREQALYLFEASESLEKPFENLILEIATGDGRQPICIVSDMFLGWTVNVAKKLGIFHSVFIAGDGYGMGLYFSLSLNENLWTVEAADEFLPVDFPGAARIHWSRIPIDLKYEEAAESWFRFRKRQFSYCLCSDSILLNSIKELGQKGVEYFRRKTGGKPVWTIGPVSNLTVKNKIFTKISTNPISDWLDLHPPGSVLYISFGSQCSLLASQMKELAMGLEESRCPFIWVVRPPVEFDLTGDFRSEWLPVGFEERMRRLNQGFLIHGWGPQLEILSHRSTGGFLSHCGWNSVVEGLCGGVVILGWPMAGEQFFNSEMLAEEVGVCVEVREKNNGCGIVGHQRIAEVIEMAMGKSEKGEEMRRKAREMSEKMEAAVKVEEGFRGSSVKVMDEFISTAISKKKR